MGCRPTCRCSANPTGATSWRRSCASSSAVRRGEPAVRRDAVLMQFGVQFFPDVRPEERSAEAYFADALNLAEEADRLGFSHIRIVEHYFHHYGGYSPNPIVFLAAAAQRTQRARLVTRAGVAGVHNPPKR